MSEERRKRLRVDSPLLLVNEESEFEGETSLEEEIFDGALTQVDSIKPRDSVSQVGSESHADSSRRASEVFSHSKGDAFVLVNNKKVCKLCQAQHDAGRYVKAKTWKYSSNTATSGLKSHLEKNHPKEYRAMYPNATATPSIPQVFQSKELALKKLSEESLNLLLSWIVENNISFRLVNSASFRLWVAKVSNFKLPDRKTLKKRLHVATAKSREALSEILESDQCVSIALTTDVRTSPTGKPYMATTAHWIDVDIQKRNVLLDFSYFPYPHSGQAIAEKIRDVAESWGILDKVISVTTDNASNAVKSMEILRESGYDIAHVRCLAHGLNLVANTGIAFFLPEINKCRAILAEIKRSPKKQQEFRALVEAQTDCKHLSVIMDVKTRWNSTFKMLQRAIELKAPLNMFCANRDDIESMTTYDWTSVKALARMLEPLYLLTLESSTQSGLTSCNFRAYVITLTKQLVNYLNDQIEGSNLYRGCLAMLSKLEELFPKNDNSLEFARLLDPNRKVIEGSIDFSQETYGPIKFTFDNENQFTAFKNMYFKVMEEMPLPVVQEDNRATQQSSFLRSQILGSASITTNDINHNQFLNEFLNTNHALAEGKDLLDSEEVLSFWRRKSTDRRYAGLVVLARRYLAIPLTSVPSEEAFSTSGLLISDRRNRLADATISDSMLLKSWMKLLEPLVKGTKKNIDRITKEYGCNDLADGWATEEEDYP